jgi:hypothetical protein
MGHPFLSLAAPVRMWLCVATLVLTVIGMTVLRFVDPGRVSGGGKGIVEFELAGSAAKAKAILESWGESGRKAAAFNLGFDYLFILGYSTFMTLMCLWASMRSVNPRAMMLGVFLAWMQWTAGLLDCTENAALLRILFHQATDGLAEIARWSALGKFGLLSCGAVYILLSLL